MNTVEPLQENGTSLVCVGASQALAAPVCHLVAKVKPLFFDQNLEALKCPACEPGQPLPNHDIRSSWERVLERENKAQRIEVRVKMKGGKNVKYVCVHKEQRL